MQHGAVEEGLTRVIGVDGEPDRRLDGLDDEPGGNRHGPRSLAGLPPAKRGRRQGAERCQTPISVKG